MLRSSLYQGVDFFLISRRSFWAHICTKLVGVKLVEETGEVVIITHYEPDTRRTTPATMYNIESRLVLVVEQRKAPIGFFRLRAGKGDLIPYKTVLNQRGLRISQSKQKTYHGCVSVPHPFH
jgi:hypothetical protein